MLFKYLGRQLTQEDDETWLDIFRYLGPKREINSIYRRAKLQFKDDEKRNICVAVFENWMKSLKLEDDKVIFTSFHSLSSFPKSTRLKALEKINEKAFVRLRPTTTFRHSSQNFIQYIRLLPWRWIS